ncbi:venom peptide isomerase heavy chain-like [Metopolophium dirhodum]|uniref:venom peptide isomerase heavy chain-like n=1 Tax=Metopolophium dirhodum TaxID=44670 RepID=UPI00298F913C|nr:venom peptide isomerase heavy chain-like [Metopolophium dirhodum]
MVALFEHNSTVYIHNGLIFNGTLFIPKDYPYVVSIRIKLQKDTDYNICTGSLLNKFLVLTAGHCCYRHQANKIQVCQGSRYKDQNYDHETDWHNVSKMYVHEKYDPGIHNQEPEHDDICLLKVAKTFPNITKFSKFGGSPNDFANGKKLSCTIIGFGSIADARDSSSDNGLFGRITTVDVLHGEKACLKPSP